MLGHLINHLIIKSIIINVNLYQAHIGGGLLVADAVGAGLAGVHEERHVGEAVAVVGVAAAPDALVHQELDLLLHLLLRLYWYLEVAWTHSIQ